jgi:hypothetical protein
MVCVFVREYDYQSVARGARGAHYLSIVSPALKLPTPSYLVTPRDTISTLLACVFLFGAFVVCFLWFGALVVCFVCIVRDLSSLSACIVRDLSSWYALLAADMLNYLLTSFPSC